MRGALDEAALQRALGSRSSRATTRLRASFGATGETMHIAAPVPFRIARRDLSAHDQPERERALSALVDAEARPRSIWRKARWCAASSSTLAPNEHAFVFTAHHIVCDGWSINVILDELARALRGDIARDEEPQLRRAARVRVVRARGRPQRDPATSARSRGILARAVREVAAAPGVADRPPAAVAQDLSRRHAHGAASIATPIAQIKKAGAKHGCTLFVTLLAAFQGLVGRLARSRRRRRRRSGRRAVAAR